MTNVASPGALLERQDTPDLLVVDNSDLSEDSAELLVAVEKLSGVHDRFDATMSDPPTDATGDAPWPEGDTAFPA
ncbi:hypothetical protein RM844_16875 [Streptomyces sp. DSM 44915]|uniref:FXSXX-COOH protein n=1 Tax=Streptomyces chisholmiae TaxID=3075540 RepID=A0ABU2JSI6_9ACTN|nr:hypothetical protein [Streptomyces sp. DSM 44915]MDT0267955.1 hypothetical protein [Streptomyces sp. DSM 44915]